MKKENKKEVGDEITTEILTKSQQKIEIRGVIKKIETTFGHKTYTVEEGSASPFKTRKIK